MRVHDAFRPRLEAYGSRGSAYDADLHGVPGLGAGLAGGLGLMPTTWGTNPWGVNAYPKKAVPDMGVAGLGQAADLGTFEQQAQRLDAIESWGTAALVGTGHVVGAGAL